MLTSGRPHFSVNVTQTDRDLFSAISGHNMSAFDPPDTTSSLLLQEILLYMKARSKVLLSNMRF